MKDYPVSLMSEALAAEVAAAEAVCIMIVIQTLLSFVLPTQTAVSGCGVIELLSLAAATVLAVDTSTETAVSGCSGAIELPSLVGFGGGGNSVDRDGSG